MASAVGTGVFQPPVQELATASAILAKVPLDLLGDTVTLPSPMLWAMTRRGRMGGAGAAINYAALASLNQNRGAYFGDMLLNNQIQDTRQPVELQWKFNYQGLTVATTDAILQYGSGMTGIRDLLSSEVMIAAASFTDYLSRAQWHTAPANSTLDVDDYESWLGQQANTIGGINRATAANAFWRPLASQNTASGTSLTPTDAEVAYQTAGFGYDYPDILALNPSPYATFKLNFTQNIRYLDPTEMAPDGSFPEHFVFNKAIVLADRFVTSTKAFFFNSRYIYPKFHEADYFTIDPWLKPSRQRVLSTMMYLTWNILCLSPSRAGIMINNVGL